MKLSVAVLATAAVTFGVPAAASAATLTTSPPKPCFGSGDRVSFHGTGFTPSGVVDFSRDGAPVASEEPITAGSDGTVNAGLTVFNQTDVERRTYAATDRTNPALTASAQLMVSELDVEMRPRSGEPSQPRTIAAVGFTTGSTLFAHIVFKGKVRNLRIGALKGACRNLTKRRRLFSDDPPFGRHLIHFDTSRRFRRNVPDSFQRISFSFRIFPNSSGTTASAAVQR